MQANNNILAMYGDGCCCQITIRLGNQNYYYEHFLQSEENQAQIWVKLLKVLYTDFPNLKIATILVPKGPLSFTGVRVLLSTAQGLAFVNKALLFCPDHFTTFSYHDDVAKAFIVFNSRRGDYFVRTSTATEPVTLQKTEIMTLAQNNNNLFFTDDQSWQPYGLSPSKMSNCLIKWYDCNSCVQWDGMPEYALTPHYL